MADNLSKKEKGFIKDYLETGNGVQSALNNYDTEDYSTAGVIAHENLKKPKIIKAITELLPDDLLAEKHLKLLNKQQVLITKNEDGEADIIQTGEIDVQAVAKGLDMAYKLKGNYAPEKKEISGSITTVNEELLNKAKEFDDFLKQHTRNPTSE